LTSTLTFIIWGHYAISSSYPPYLSSIIIVTVLQKRLGLKEIKYIPSTHSWKMAEERVQPRQQTPPHRHSEQRDKSKANEVSQFSQLKAFPEVHQNANGDLLGPTCHFNIDLFLVEQERKRERVKEGRMEREWGGWIFPWLWELWSSSVTPSYVCLCHGRKGMNTNVINTSRGK
jgi:hypothetical protein